MASDPKKNHTLNFVIATVTLSSLDDVICRPTSGHVILKSSDIYVYNNNLISWNEMKTTEFWLFSEHNSILVKGVVINLIS
jgi:hypothetical protein